MRIKVKYLYTSAFIAVVFLGCGADTTPTGSLLNKIKNDKIVGTKAISLVVKDYYKRSLKNINSPQCTDLDTESTNPIDISIVDFSKKYCSKKEKFDLAMQKILNVINKKQSTTITFDMINGTQKYMDNGFSKKDAKIFLEYNIPVSEAKKIIHVYHDNILTLKKIFFKNGVTTLNEMNIWYDYFSGYDIGKSIILWKTAGIKNGEDLVLFIKAGIEDVDSLKKWVKMTADTDSLKKWVKVAHVRLNKHNFLIIKELVEGNVSADEYKAWKTANRYDYMTGLRDISIEQMVKAKAKKFSPEDFVKWKKIGSTLIGLDDILEARDRKLTLKEYTLWANKANIRRISTILDAKEKGFAPDTYLSQTKK